MIPFGLYNAIDEIFYVRVVDNLRKGNFTAATRDVAAFRNLYLAVEKSALNDGEFFYDFESLSARNEIFSILRSLPFESDDPCLAPTPDELKNWERATEPIGW